MKFSLVLVFCSAVSAFHTPSVPAAHNQRVAPLPMVGTSFAGTIDLQDTAQRDVYAMQEWAAQYGVQKADGVDVTTQDGEDWFVFTNQPIAAGSPVIYVPAQITISSSEVEREFGGNLISAENALVQQEESAQRLPLFRLMVKILAEYEKGPESPYYPWLNGLPRRFYNGVSMTDDCFKCLPPYAGWLSTLERNNYKRFVSALRQGYLPLSQQTLQDDNLIAWAYNIALTRHNEVWQPRRQKLLAPLADMFNHATDPNVAITYDEQGNCMATAMYDIPAGSALTVSYGDPTNPTPLFAKYGFLVDDAATIFCKAMQLKPQIDALGYDFKDLLIQTQTGEIAPKVWDIFLYKLLENDPANADGFYVACKANDEATKQAYHQQYFAYTLQAMKEHFDTIMHDVDRLTMKAQSYDLQSHPRVPVIVAHNNLVRYTFEKVVGQLAAMG